jgi:hypothetical protein
MEFAMFYVFLFFLVVIGLPVAKAVGLLEITWNQAFSPIYFILASFLLVFVIAFFIIFLGAL